MVIVNVLLRRIAKPGDESEGLLGELSGLARRLVGVHHGIHSIALGLVEVLRFPSKLSSLSFRQLLAQHNVVRLSDLVCDP